MSDGLCASMSLFHSAEGKLLVYRQGRESTGQRCTHVQVALYDCGGPRPRVRGKGDNYDDILLASSLVTAQDCTSSSSKICSSEASRYYTHCLL